MRKATSFLTVFVVVLLISICPARADVTIEMKSSLSGIPFLGDMEMYQTMCVRPGNFCTITEVEMSIADTSISTKSRVSCDLDNSTIELCDWEKESCTEISIGDIENLLTTDLKEMITDSVSKYIDSIVKYISIDKFDMEFSGNEKTVSGYNCRELLFDMEGMFSMPVPKLPGQIKVIVDGTSWVTDKFDNYSEYIQVMDDFKNKFFTPKIESFVTDLMTLFGIDKSLIDKYYDYYKYIQVQNAYNLTLEIWNENMDVPSMSFNLRYNSVLIDLSTDKIPDEVFTSPPGFSKEGVDLKGLMKESF